MKKVIGIIVGLAVLAGLGAAGYYLFKTSTGVSEDLTILDAGDVETETVAFTYSPAVLYDPDSDDEEMSNPEYAMESYEEGERLFDLMEENEGVFYSADTTGEPEDEGYPLVMSNKAEFAKAIDLASANEIDPIMTNIGVGVKGFLNQDAEGMKDWDVSERRKGMFPSGVGYDFRQAEPGMMICFDGEDPGKYFSDRDLSIKCDSISAEKVTAFKGDGFIELFIIYDAKVRTERCEGDSFFPAEGESEDMRIMVGAHYAKQSVTKYNFICFR